MEPRKGKFPEIIPRLKGQEFTQAEILKHYRTHIPVLKPVLGRHCFLQVYDDNVRKGVVEINFKPAKGPTQRPAAVGEQTWLKLETDLKLFQDYCELVVEPTINSGMMDYVISTLQEVLKVNAQQIDQRCYHIVQSYCGLIGAEQHGLQSRRALLNLYKVFNKVWMILQFQSSSAASGTGQQPWDSQRVSDAVMCAFQRSMSEAVDPGLFDKLCFEMNGSEIIRIGVGEGLLLAAPYVLGPASCAWFSLYVLGAIIGDKAKIYVNAAHMATSDNQNVHQKALKISENSEKSFKMITEEVLVPLSEGLQQVLLDIIEGKWELWSSNFEKFLASISKNESLTSALEILCPVRITQTESEIDPEFVVVTADRGFNPNDNILGKIQSSRLDFLHTMN